MSERRASATDITGAGLNAERFVLVIVKKVPMKTGGEVMMEKSGGVRSGLTSNFFLALIRLPATRLDTELAVCI
jgi:hypothetical protein